MAPDQPSTQVDDFTPVSGSCYCQSATYSLTAAPIFTNCCHCHNCQALTGSAFATNIVIETSNIRLTSESASISTRSSKNAAGEFSGTATTCSSCGTLLWATHPFFTEAISFLRAGTLTDAQKYVTPSAHFFVRSKHPWIQLPEGVSKFEALPGPGVSLFGEEGEARIKAAQATIKDPKA